MIGLDEKDFYSRLFDKFTVHPFEDFMKRLSKIIDREVSFKDFVNKYSELSLYYEKHRVRPLDVEKRIFIDTVRVFGLNLKDLVNLCSISDSTLTRLHDSVLYCFNIFYYCS